ncbi:MAG TPA: lysophospholipid acyltransferase family protein [Acidimicrobiales bacterium]|nr:lysophospholipid acyltransferase family protein [Acidimicrobiales bacterium]
MSTDGPVGEPRRRSLTNIPRRSPEVPQVYRGGAQEAAARLAALRRPFAFPLGSPPWPASVPRPQKKPTLGIHYDTGWARHYPVRLARAAYTELVTRPLMNAVARPTVVGLDRFEHAQGPLIFAANHSSHLDAPLVLSVLPDRWRHRLVILAGADYFFDSRLKSVYFAFALNAIPIERIKVSRASPERAETLAREGWNLLIFPEGGRSPDGWGQEHHAGAGWLAARTGRPLVPVHIKGTGRLWPRGARRVYTGETTVTFGAAIEADRPARQLVARLEEAIALLADEASSDWWSARRRAAQGATPPLTGPEASAWRRAWALGPSPKDGARRRSPAGEKRWPPKDFRSSN